VILVRIELGEVVDEIATLELTKIGLSADRHH
jgi:hypothetical protein